MVPYRRPQYKSTSSEPQVLAFLTFCIALCRLPSPGDGNEAIGALIQNYIREIEELR